MRRLANTEENGLLFCWRWQHPPGAKKAAAAASPAQRFHRIKGACRQGVHSPNEESAAAAHRVQPNLPESPARCLRNRVNEMPEARRPFLFASFMRAKPLAPRLSSRKETPGPHSVRHSPATASALYMRASNASYSRPR
ncbi:hypothetical protein MRX96_054963 [Rhipicephalus microplus]